MLRLLHFPKSSKAHPLWRTFSGSLILGLVGSAQGDEVRFNRDIRPLMSDTCFHCHGFDAKTREANLRLDIREEALKPAKSGDIPIVPGKPEASEIITRIFSDDKDEVMPSPKAHKEFTQAQKDLFKRWVAEGAKYEEHWAYTPLTRPAVPQGPKNPVDAFIQQRLAKENITPSPEAPREQLLRRLSLDLTGLPPTPEQVQAFVNDQAPGAYERQVKRLLDSPHFGERMAVWWLDIARFSDTVGFHGDQNQRIFPYRDYVINAFNSNKRFDQFTLEQLAGDLLPNPTPEQLTATGYNRLNMMTREGGAQPKEYLAKYGAERVRAVSAAWYGSTFGCAECHDHKFDPIKTADFYSLQSFFADVKQWGVYMDYGSSRNPELAGFSNESPFPPELQVVSPYLVAKEKQLKATLDLHLQAAQKRLAAGPQAPLNAWLETTKSFLKANPSGWHSIVATPTAPVAPKSPEDSPDKADDPKKKAEKPAAKNAKPKGRQKAPESAVELKPGAMQVASIRVKVLAPKKADAKPDAKAEADKKPAPVRLEVAVKSADGKTRKVGAALAEASLKIPDYKSGHEVYNIKSLWRFPAPKAGQEPQCVWLLDAPIKLAADESLVVSLGIQQPVEVSVSPLADINPLNTASQSQIQAILTDPKSRTAAQARQIADSYLLGVQSEREAFTTAVNLAEEVLMTQGGRTWTLVTQAVEPLTVRILPRGNWQDESGPVVLPSTPSFLPGRIESTPTKRLTRLDLAKWLCSKENPLTARAVANRLWQPFFGTGISAALDDLGSQGEPPVHAELLDWLACEFRDGGWDIKHMIELMVTSATYRQSSRLRPELRDKDPANRLLASQNPRRLDAEFVRDNALFIAGQLQLDAIGGPSLRPYQPAGYYDALQFPDRIYINSKGPEQWRRGVYMHWQRAYLHPMLSNFDAPARDESCALRNLSNTPQQALTLLNDPSFVEAARLFASRILASPSKNDDSRLDFAFQLALARSSRDNEKSSLKNFLAQQREYYRAHSKDAEALLKVGDAPVARGEAAELAAWTTVCRVVLNLQEVITRY